MQNKTYANGRMKVNPIGALLCLALGVCLAVFSMGYAVGVQATYRGGDRFTWEPSINLRKGEAFNTGFAWSVNDIDLPGGAFQTNLIRLRLAYSFTPRIFIQSLAQYNDRANLWSLNLRFTWIQKANTGLFVVYNEIRDLHATDLGIPDRSLTIKFSRLFDVFN